MITKVLVLQSPCTLRELQEFVDEVKEITSHDMDVNVRVFGKDIRFKWPQDSEVDEGQLAKGTGGKS